jgi:Ankyrin repeat
MYAGSTECQYLNFCQSHLQVVLQCGANKGSGHIAMCDESAVLGGHSFARLLHYCRSQCVACTVLVYSTKWCGGHILTIGCLQDGSTPLLIAAVWGRTETVQLLLSCRGTNVNAPNKVNVPRSLGLCWSGSWLLVYWGFAVG